jgi:hypothetical protein
MVEISGFSHFFGFRRPGQPRTMDGEVSESLKNSPKWHVGMAIAKNGLDDGLLSSRSFWNSFSMLPIKREFLHRRGQHLCLVQERKAENEECL